MFDNTDTIVAPATAAGGALCVIRISGPQAVGYADSIFRGRGRLAAASAPALRYGRIVDTDGTTVDDAVVSIFRGPNSYTGDDTVEISCHGSQYIVSRIIGLLTAAGARMASAGEFTARAYLAGRMDLSQAEAVADMIAADSQAAHAMASTQMRGGYSTALHSLRDELLRLCSLLELELDFSEEDVAFADRTELRRIMESIGAEIDRLAGSFALGNAIKEGVAVAIVGAPNVGKSTLLNRILGENRAMVSEIAGTTRDTVEERRNIDGVTFRFIDTAGLHDTDDRLERLGIERTAEAISRAHIVVQLAESADGFFDIELSEGQRLVRVWNKADRGMAEGLPEGVIAISALRGDGVELLLKELRAGVDTRALYAGDAVVSSARHRAALEAAGESLRRAMAAMSEGLPTDLLSEDIRQVIHHLGEITGEICTEEILQTIFSRFCVGK